MIRFFSDALCAVLGGAIYYIWARYADSQHGKDGEK